jgi:hypothetical protein
VPSQPNDAAPDRLDDSSEAPSISIISDQDILLQNATGAAALRRIMRRKSLLRKH